MLWNNYCSFLSLGLCVHIRTLSIHFSAVIGLRWSTRQTDAGRPARQTCLDVTMYRLTALIALNVPGVHTFLHGITCNMFFLFLILGDYDYVLVLWEKYRREQNYAVFTFSSIISIV